MLFGGGGGKDTLNLAILFDVIMTLFHENVLIVFKILTHQ